MDQNTRIHDQIQQVLIAQGQISTQMVSIATALGDLRTAIKDVHAKIDTLDTRITTAEAHIAEMKGEKAGYRKAVSFVSTFIGIILGVAGTVLSYIAFFK